MRCEICNKSETYLVYDGKSAIHWYCGGCLDEIETTTLEMEDDEWFQEDLVSIEEYQEYDDVDETLSPDHDDLS